jgi:hypothetical protein
MFVAVRIFHLPRPSIRSAEAPETTEMNCPVLMAKFLVQIEYFPGTFFFLPLFSLLWPIHPFLLIHWPTKFPSIYNIKIINCQFTAECPPSYVCALSNRPGLYVCCHPFPIRRRSPPNAFDHPRILMTPAT